MHMDQKEFARMGGNAVKKKYGLGHFSKVGKMGGNALIKKYGPNYFKQIRKGQKPSETS